MTITIKGKAAEELSASTLAKLAEALEPRVEQSDAQHVGVLDSGLKVTLGDAVYIGDLVVVAKGIVHYILT